MKGSILIQRIITNWSKASRTGKLQSLRGTVPEKLVMPAFPAKIYPSSYLVHEVGYSEKDAYESGNATLNIIPITDPYRMGCISLYPTDETVRVFFEGPFDPLNSPAWFVGYSGMGAPRRVIPIQPLALTLNTWGQIQFNGRFSDTTDWRYTKEIFNIAWSDLPQPELFCKTPPAHLFTSMKRLW